MLGSRRSFLVPLADFRPMIRWLIVRPYPPRGFSVSSGVSSVTSPSYTSFVSRTRRPIDALESIGLFASRWHRSRTDCPPEVLHECLCFLDLSRVDLTTNDRTEGDFGSQLLRHGEGQSSLSSSGSTSQEDSPTGHLLRLDQVNNDTACLLCQSFGLVQGSWAWKTRVLGGNVVAYLTGSCLSNETIS